MQNKEISNWDLTAKLLNDNESEIHMERNIHGINLYLIFNDIPEHNFYLPFIVDNNTTIKEYVNNMSVYSFRTFCDKLNEIITKTKDTDKWYEKLVIEYQKELKK